MLIFLNITAKTTGKDKGRCAISRPVPAQTTFIQKYVVTTAMGNTLKRLSNI